MTNRLRLTPIAFEDGDILLCKGNGAVAKLIQWGTKSVYSHVAVRASAKLSLIIEAVPEGGVRAIALENFNTRYDVYRVKDPKSFDLTEVVAYLIKMLARKYDFVSAIKLGWKLTKRRFHLIQLFGLKVANNKKAADALQENQDYFCSELCYRAFEAGGLDIVPQIGDAETTSPGDIANSPLIQKI